MMRLHQRGSMHEPAQTDNFVAGMPCPEHTINYVGLPGVASMMDQAFVMGHMSLWQDNIRV